MLQRRGPLFWNTATLGWIIVGVMFKSRGGDPHRLGRPRRVCALDSLIDIFASVVVIWQSDGRGPRSGAVGHAQLIGDGRSALRPSTSRASSIGHTHPLDARSRPSCIGFIWLVMTCLATTATLAWGKQVTEQRALGKQMLVDRRAHHDGPWRVDLSNGFWSGVGFDAGLGWWWADPAFDGRRSMATPSRKASKLGATDLSVT